MSETHSDEHCSEMVWPKVDAGTLGRGLTHWTTGHARRCSRLAVEDGYCAQHAARRRRIQAELARRRAAAERGAGR